MLMKVRNIKTAEITNPILTSVDLRQAYASISVNLERGEAGQRPGI